MDNNKPVLDFINIEDIPRKLGGAMIVASVNRKGILRIGKNMNQIIKVTDKKYYKLAVEGQLTKIHLVETDDSVNALSASKSAKDGSYAIPLLFLFTKHGVTLGINSVTYKLENNEVKEYEGKKWITLVRK